VTVINELIEHGALHALQVNMRYSSINESDFAISVNLAQFYIAMVSLLFVVLCLFRFMLVIFIYLFNLRLIAVNCR